MTMAYILVNSRFQLVLRFNMENWARANCILSSRKRKILVDRQNFGYKFERESETGAIYWVWRLRALLGCTATASTIERNDASFTKNVKNTHNHSSKLVEKRVKVAEQEAVENAVRNLTLTCRAVMAELANTLQTDSMAAACRGWALSNRGYTEVGILYIVLQLVKPDCLHLLMTFWTWTTRTNI